MSLSDWTPWSVIGVVTVSGAPYGGPGFMRLWMKLGYKFELFGRNYRRKLEVFGTSLKVCFLAKK